MKTSQQRILTTHVGSLPRPAELLAANAGANGILRDAVAKIVQRQSEIGLDIIDDGEFGKPGFITYVNERLAGFEPGSPKGNPWAGSREAQSFPEFYEQSIRSAGSPTTASTHIQMVCTGPIQYKGLQQLQRDIDNLKAALNGVSAEEAFIPAISPSNIEDWQKNAFYKTDDEFLFAIADAMHEEYKAIVDAGFLLQIDDPRLVTYYMLHPRASLEDCRKFAELRVEAINHALRGIPEDRVRFHTCYGINMGPRIHDMELKNVVDIILKIRAGAYSFEAANPRHEHEWQVWENLKLPAGKILIPGMITQSSVLVEHPELVAQRIVRFANVVGRQNVIAGADCGFSSFAGSLEIHPSIVWEKFKSLVEGARLASKQLWA
ncbi:MAG TPA: cobalamin-independent methionine synthase II family protein [Candidatus Acidoferrales bacterium]|jgi:5-methyltetrahydropteroyltriglutamate--homocysteine methyltransferase|nr:cobalamin-independent methionine synthase II family protein [Candidatus Acidoferrales bacterium]